MVKENLFCQGPRKYFGKKEEQVVIAKKTRHNAVEQRRRTRVRDSIKRLRELIPCVNDEKATDALTLASAIDYIQYLEGQSTPSTREAEAMESSTDILKTNTSPKLPVEEGVNACVNIVSRASEPGWKTILEDRGIVLSTKTYLGRTSFKVVSFIDATPEKLFTFLKSIRKRRYWDLFFLRGRVIHTNDTNGIELVYLSRDSLNTSEVFDYSLVVCSNLQADQSYVSASQSVFHSSVLPKPGCVRKVQRPAGFIVKPFDTGSVLVWIAESEHDGWSEDSITLEESEALALCMNNICAVFSNSNGLLYKNSSISKSHRIAFYCLQAERCVDKILSRMDVMGHTNSVVDKSMLRAEGEHIVYFKTDEVINHFNENVWKRDLRSFILEHRVLETVDENSRIVSIVFKNVALGEQKYESCLLYTTQSIGSGQYVISFRSVLHYLAPINRTRKRVQMLSSGFLFSPCGENTKISYSFYLPRENFGDDYSSCVTSDFENFLFTSMLKTQILSIGSVSSLKKIHAETLFSRSLEAVLSMKFLLKDYVESLDSLSSCQDDHVNGNNNGGSHSDRQGKIISSRNVYE